MGTKAAWTPERRAKQAEAIRRWQPWTKSTGPRTEAGKAVSSRNAEVAYRALMQPYIGIGVRHRQDQLALAEAGCLVLAAWKELRRKA